MTDFVNWKDNVSGHMLMLKKCIEIYKNCIKICVNVLKNVKSELKCVYFFVFCVHIMYPANSKLEISFRYRTTNPCNGIRLSLRKKLFAVFG